MGTFTTLPQKSLTTKGYFILSLAIAAQLKQYSEQLQEIITTPLGQPVKLYQAYKSYSLQYNQWQLQLLLHTSPACQHGSIRKLLWAYTDAQQHSSL